MAPPYVPTLVQASAIVQNTGTAPFNTTHTLAKTPELGNVLVVKVFGWGNGAPPDFSVSDNHGSDWQVLATGTTGASNTGCRILAALVSSNVLKQFIVTVRNNGSGASADVNFEVTEWAGLRDHRADQATNAAGTGTAPSTGTTPTTLYADELLAAVMTIDSVGTTIANNAAGSNPSAGWAERAEETGDTHQAGESDDVVVTATGAFVHVWTTSDNQAWSGAIATLVRATPTQRYAQAKFPKPLLRAA